MKWKTVAWQVVTWSAVGLLLLAVAIGDSDNQCGYNNNALEMECSGD